MSTSFHPVISEAADDGVEVLFHAALKQPREELTAFLDQECASDAELRAEVDELLRAYHRDDSLLRVDAPGHPELEAELARLKPEEAGEKIGPYKLLEQIGEGGFGRVWVVEQEKPSEGGWR